MAIASKLTERELVLVRALLDLREEVPSGSLEMAQIDGAFGESGLADLGVKPWRADFDRLREEI